MIVRDAGEIRRGGLAPVRLEAGETAVWDGRFELIAQQTGVTVRSLAGGMAQLGGSARRSLQALPAESRPALPALIDADEGLDRLVLAPALGINLRCLVEDRLLSACGVISKEPAA